MGVFNNDVGRPSNKTIMDRNILKGILIVVISIGLVACGYLLNDYQKEENKDSENKNIITTTNNQNKNYDPKQAFDKFAEDNSLIMYKDEQAFDINSLQSKNCLTATVARSNDKTNGYSIEIFTFSDDESSKKYYEEQVNYQKEDNEVITIYEKDILTDKTENNHDVFEIKSTVEDIYNSQKRVYNYYCSVRIDNYIITLYSTNDYDMIEELIKLKDELNVC